MVAFATSECLARAERAHEANRAAMARGDRTVKPTVALLRLLAAQYLAARYFAGWR